MLTIDVPSSEIYDEYLGEFRTIRGQKLKLEHSLVSISKWESKWHKSFISSPEKTSEELVDYIRCMTLTPNVDPELYHYLTGATVKKIVAYIQDPMTATTFYEDPAAKGSRKEVITSELIYYWMVAYRIPFDCQKWHINRLLTLIRICGIKNTPPKKMSKTALARRNSALNNARRARLNTRG